MPQLSEIQQLFGLAAAAGFISHWGYFIHGEHHQEAPLILRLWLVLVATMIGGLSKGFDLELGQATMLTAGILSTYLAALSTSIFIYRVFFHRLISFPGPFGAKVSKFWHFSKIARKCDNHFFLDEMHKKYGDFVRTGPNEISIYDADAVPLLLGPGSKCTKAPWYDSGHPIVSLNTIRDRSWHDRRRKIWDLGFNGKALRSYEPRITRYSKLLVKQISARTSTPIDAAKWFHFFGFDVMGEFAFGESFGMLETGEAHFGVALLESGMAPVGAFTPVPYMLSTLASIPGLAGGFKTFVSWCSERVKERRKMKMDEPDVMSHLIHAADNAEPSQRAFEDFQLGNDSRLIIVAGSDTTSATLTYVFYHLAKDKNQIPKLRAELDPIQNEKGEFDARDLGKAEHLNGAINEALRLHPPVPSGLLRLTPPEGIMIGDKHIPGNTTVLSPPYTVGRLESCYQNANEFIPERWYPGSNLIKNKNAFAPFSLGPYSCVGKQLALQELRTVISLLVTKFDVELAPGEDGKRLLQESKDYFTISLTELNLVFTPRK